jgi:threonine dehydrogenase-like Zn-dependent dehydrogenase
MVVTRVTFCFDLGRRSSRSQLSDRMVAPANCALATMVWATEYLPKPCRKAVIQGAGMLGLCGCALLRVRGVEQVIVVDHDPARLALVGSFGGTPIHDGADSICSPGSADAVFEVAGTSAVVTEGVRYLRVGGYYAFIGMVHPSTTLELSGQTVVRQCVTLRGFHNYAPPHLAKAIQFLLEHGRKLPWEKVVSPAFELAGINAAFVEARTRKWQRVSIRP